MEISNDVIDLSSSSIKLRPTNTILGFDSNDDNSDRLMSLLQDNLTNDDGWRYITFGKESDSTGKQAELGFKIGNSGATNDWEKQNQILYGFYNRQSFIADTEHRIGLGGNEWYPRAIGLNLKQNTIFFQIDDGATNADSRNWTIRTNSSADGSFDIGHSGGGMVGHHEADFSNNKDQSKFTITRDGNIGIGTTEPGEKFVVKNNGNTYIKVLNTDGSSENQEVGIQFVNQGYTVV